MIRRFFILVCTILLIIFYLILLIGELEVITNPTTPPETTIATEPLLEEKIADPIPEATSQGTLPEDLEPEIETSPTENTECTTEPSLEEDEEIAENETSIIYENVFEWAMTHENTDSISIWKKTDQDGNLIIALKNDQEETIATFKYNDIDTQYEDWELCNRFFEQITTRDLIDYAFTAYHEVGGKRLENVQAQVCTLINRQYCPHFPNTIREVIEQKKQYSCVWPVVHRKLKSDLNSNLQEKYEAKDIEICFRQVLLVMGGELIQEVPTNVVFAAKGKQGSGVWKVIDGTYYCFWNW